MTRSAFEAFFMPMGAGLRGQRWCAYHAPASTARGAVVHVHPFAEEMNKSRRMAALQSRAMADAGFAVLRIDLLGCGDSSGNFDDATWDDWIDDVLEAASWLHARHPVPLTLWGLRAGCLVAAQCAPRLQTPCHLLYWQPPTLGKAVLSQFLRLKTFAAASGGDATVTSRQDLLAALLAGSRDEVAGYRLSPELVAGLDDARLEPPPRGGRVTWLEVSSRPDARLLPASAATVRQWQHEGLDIATRVVPGPSFWQTVEIEQAPALIDATLACVDRFAAA